MHILTTKLLSLPFQTNTSGLQVHSWCIPHTMNTSTEKSPGFRINPVLLSKGFYHRVFDNDRKRSKVSVIRRHKQGHLEQFLNCQPDLQHYVCLQEHLN